ncbi:MAG TPA: hypothetical protein VG603_03945 [Chitinophagales bacterium]|nr:hypothetical protein [Chitinophagales bacterium]
MALKGLKLKHLLLPLLLVVYALAAINGCFYYEEGTEPYFTILTRGDFTGRPESIPNPYGFWMGITHVMKYLYIINNNFDWYAFFLLIGYLMLLIQLKPIVAIVGHTYKANTPKWLFSASVIIGAFAFSQNLVVWQGTRMPLLLAGAALFNMFNTITKKAPASKKRILTQGWNTLCFIYAAISRNEPAMLAVGIFVPFFLITCWLKPKIKSYAWPVVSFLTIGGMAVLLNIPFNQTDAQYLAFRKYQFTLWDFKQPLQTLHLKTNADSVTIAAANTQFQNDTNRINTAFFHRIGLLPLDKTPASMPYYFENLTGVGKKLKERSQRMFEHHYALIFLYLLLTIFIPLLYNGAKEAKRWYWLANTYFVAMYLGLAIFMKMESRLFVPMLWCFILQNLVWFSLFENGGNKPAPQLNSIKITAYLIILAIIAFGQIKLYINEFRFLKDREARSVELVKTVCALPQKIVVVGIDVLDKLHPRPFGKPFEKCGKSFVSVDNGIHYMLSTYAEYMKGLTGSSQTDSIMHFLYSQHQNVVYMVDINRERMIENYFKVNYNCPLIFPATGEIKPAAEIPGPKVFPGSVYVPIAIDTSAR